MHIGAYDRMATDTQTAGELVGARFTSWVHRYGVARKLAILLSIGAIGSGVATYAALSGTPPFGPDPRSVLVLLFVDLVLLLSIGAIILRRLVLLWVARRRGSAGSRLHTRIVALFSIVAVAPAIIVAVFSALFFNLGVQAWFSQRVETALDSGPFILGTDFSGADIMLGYTLLSAKHLGVLTSEFPNANRYLDMLVTRPALLTAIAA